MNKIVVGLPCYNEGENITSLLEKWLAEEETLKEKGLKLIITPLDDKSTDNTKEILEEMSKKHKQIKPLYHEVNKNLGGGLNTLVNNFLDNYSTGDILVIMDGDNTQEPKYIKSMVEKMERGKDCVIASRYRKGSKVMGVPKHRILMSYLARIYYTLVLHIKNVRDYTCGYRSYSYDILEKSKDIYGDNLITRTSFACMMELLYKIYMAGANIGEVPFVLRYDYKQGESKIDVVSTSKDSILTALKIKKEAREMIKNQA